MSLKAVPVPAAVPADAADDRGALATAVAHAFAAAGPLAQADAGYVEREVQQHFAQAVAEAVDRRTALVAEAGTGVGKTFAYLVPLLLSGRRALVSTATKSLQDQLFLRDLPRLTRGTRGAGAAGAAQGPRQLPLPAPAQAGAPGRRAGPAGPAARPLRGARAVAGARPGRRRQPPATWPSSTAWTSARP